MEALSTKTLELSARGPGQAAAARLFYGNYGYYLDRLEREGASGESGPPSPPSPASQEPGPRQNRDGLESRLKRNLIRRLEREEREILKALESLEAERSALEAELARPAVYSSAEKARAVKVRLDRTAVEAEGKSREWEAKAEELAKAQAGDAP
jgi:ATP-binding cassette subfamily F protein 3